MIKRVNGFTGKIGSVGFDPTKSFAIDKPQNEKNEKNENEKTQKPYPEKERKSKFQKK